MRHNDFKFPILSSSSTLMPDQIYFTNWKNYKMDYHSHPVGSLEFNYVTSGCCNYYINGKKYVLKKKNLLIINGEVPHKLVFISPEPCLILGMSFLQCSIKPGFTALNDIVNCFRSLQKFFETFNEALLIADAKNLLPLFQESYREAQGKNNETYLNLLINKLLIDISRLILNDNQQITDYIEKAKQYIDYHYFSIEDIGEIADYVGLNKVYLQRIFKESMTCTIWNYVTQVRMKKAAFLLTNTNVPVGDIDERVGINSRQNFYITFKKTYDMSPYEYRNLYKK